jgi:hypothetical protein
MPNGFLAVFGGMSWAHNKKVIPEVAVSWVGMGGVASGEWSSFGAFGITLHHA